jgi:hypothetical protein
VYAKGVKGKCALIMTKKEEIMKQLATRVPGSLYEKIIKNKTDELNRSLEVRRCLSVSFVFLKMFNKLAKLDSTMARKVYNSLGEIDRGVLDGFLRRYPEEG